METNDFFYVSSFEPERLEKFMRAITDMVIAFSEMGMEVIGPNISRPGHQMLCHPKWAGIAISDDNMSMLSPKVYEVAALPYSSRLVEHFGGIALHSCGVICQNISMLLCTPKMQQVEHAACIRVRDSEPYPHTPEALRDAYRGSYVILSISTAGSAPFSLQ